LAIAIIECACSIPESFIFRRISKNDLADYVKTHYKSPRIVLAAAGGVNHNDLVKAAEKHFSGLKSAYEGVIPVLEPCRFTGQSFTFSWNEMSLEKVWGSWFFFLSPPPLNVLQHPVCSNAITFSVKDILVSKFVHFSKLHTLNLWQ
jgi:hypothetical protein